MTTTARSFGRPLSTPALALLMILALLIAITAVGVTTGTFRLPPAPVVNGPIVFGRYSANLENTEIYLARPDGSGIHRVLAGAYECPQFSPDGKRLFVLTRDQTAYVLDLGAGQEQAAGAIKAPATEGEKPARPAKKAAKPKAEAKTAAPKKKAAAKKKSEAK